MYIQKRKASSKFALFSETGTPVINIFDSFNKNINFIDYPYVAFKLTGKITAESSVTSLSTQVTGTLTSNNVTCRSLYTNNTASVLLDTSEYYSEQNYDTYKDDLIITIKPWGTQNTSDLTDYVIIKEIALFDNIIAAENWLE